MTAGAPHRGGRDGADGRGTTGPSSDPRRFLHHGRLQALPRRWDDKRAVARYLAAVVLPTLLDPVPEGDLTARLADVADDPVGLRRTMVDLGAVHRTRDGAEYWRTELTEYEDLAREASAG